MRHKARNFHNSRSQRLKFVSNYPREQQQKIVETLVLVDKLGRKRHIKTEADFRAFIIGFLIGKETSK